MYDVKLSPPGWVLDADLKALGLDIRSYREPLKRAIQQVMSPSFQTNFEVGGRPAWKPVSDATRRQKSTDQTLVRSGLLWRKAGQLNIWSLNSTEASVQGHAATTYGYYHQFGLGVPERPWATIQKEDEDKIEAIFVEWIRERLVAHGFTSVSASNALEALR